MIQMMLMIMMIIKCYDNNINKMIIIIMKMTIMAIITSIIQY